MKIWGRHIGQYLIVCCVAVRVLLWSWVFVVSWPLHAHKLCEMFCDKTSTSQNRYSQ
jgi:hypothetical protein